MSRTSSRLRRAMTLVELLVVMVIMLILATIVVAFAPAFQDSQKVSRGADQLQGWLLMARQWAKTNRAPTGLRLLVNNKVVTDLQYIQQPPTYTVPFYIGSATPSIRRLTTLTTDPSKLLLEAAPTGYMIAPGTSTVPPNIGDFSGGFGFSSDPAIQATWPVQVRDFLVVKGTPHQIKGFGSSTTPAQECDQVFLESSVNPPLANGAGTPLYTSEYYFVRGPRPITGEATLKLPQDVAILIDSGQVNYCSNVTDNSTGFIDILFSPSGEVLSPVSSNKIILWVRDVSKPLFKADGTTPNILEDSLIAINNRTGMIAAQPVNPDSSDYYLYTKDGRPSGL